MVCRVDGVRAPWPGEGLLCNKTLLGSASLPLCAQGVTGSCHYAISGPSRSLYRVIFVPAPPSSEWALPMSFCPILGRL